jgi:porphyrinogen peroxidase
MPLHEFQAFELALSTEFAPLTTSQANTDSTSVPQPVVQALTRAAIFIVATVRPIDDSRAAVRSLCSDLSALFREIKAGPRHAVATPGDLLFHIRAKRMDLCFELATQIMARLGDAVSPVDEVHGFRYFDDRDLIGFVDGTENPTAQEAIDAVHIGAEDPAFAGGSYVIVQKYLHDIRGWNALSTEAQERIIGRTKLSDIELDDAVKPTSAHNALTTIVEGGKEIKIVRDNMPFGRVTDREFGTYFIGYARSPRTIEQMLENMFVGRPPGNYDRLLDFSFAKTGNLFFIPSATFLDDVGEDVPAAGQELPETTAAAPVQTRDGSLGIGSLKGDPAR